MAALQFLRLIEAEEAELTSRPSDVLPPEVAGLIGSQTREVRTLGDGACALHAAFSTIESGESLALAESNEWSLSSKSRE